MKVIDSNLLLKNSIEAGASLEALAKGEVKFSRGLTLHELQDQRTSLLYDRVVSTQASARMVKVEPSGFNPLSKVCKLDDLKGNGKITEKRKAGSICVQYYRMRKRIKDELLYSPGVSFFDKCNNSSTVTDCEYADHLDSDLNISNEDDVLCTLNTEKTIDDIPNSPLLDSSENVVEDPLCNADATAMLVATPSIQCHEEVQGFLFHGDQQDVCQWKADYELTSISHLDSVQLNEGKVICILNTEESEIPCNDDIFFLIHPSPSVIPQIAKKSIDPLPSFADENGDEQGLSAAKYPAPYFTRPQMDGPDLSSEFDSIHPHAGYTFKSDSADTKCLHPLSGQPDMSSSAGHSRLMHINPLPTGNRVLAKNGLDTSATYSELSLRTEVRSFKMIDPELMDNNPSLSDHNNSDSDGDLHYFSDIEALILRLDLEYAQGSCITSEVARHQYKYSNRSTIGPEYTTCSSLIRSMSSLSAFAIFYGRHFHYYIKKTEVTIGRSTDDTDVDINLRKEGHANMISSLQATIKMETDGSFILKNIGKSSISINGNSIAHGQVAALSSSCLIEISGMNFLFEINDRYVRRYLDHIIKKSQEASALMVNVKPSGFNSSSTISRLDDLKRNEKTREKRKGGSIHVQYYRKRKRRKDYLFNSPDLRFFEKYNNYLDHVTLNNEAQFGDAMFSDCLANKLRFEKTDFVDKGDSANSSTLTEGDILCSLNTEDTMDDIPDSQLLDSPENVLEDSFCNADAATLLVAPPKIKCHSESKNPSFYGDQQGVSHWEADVVLTSLSHLDSVQLSKGKFICILNTEDSKISCNADIFLQTHPSPFVTPQITTDIIDQLFSADEKDGEQELSAGKYPIPSFTRSQMDGPDLSFEFDSGQPHVGCTFRSELFNSRCLHPFFGQSDKITNPVLIGDRVLAGDSVDTSASYSEMSLQTEAVSLNNSISDHNNSNSDGDLPCLSDIEALIHRMDLEYAAESYITGEVGMHQNNHTIIRLDQTESTIIRLDQTALYSLPRARLSDALAVFYSRHFNYFIKKTEVTIRRSTEDNDVDIDFQKERRANMIFRRQATTKMEIDGSFTLKNLRKSSISMNGNSVAHGQVAALGSSCLIEISGMNFMFEINDKYVRQHLDNIFKKSQAHPSACMVKVEPSGFNSLSAISRLDDLKGNKKTREKRKGGSIRIQYYRKRKRIKDDIFHSPDLRFFEKCNKFQDRVTLNHEDQVSDAMSSESLANRLRFEETDFEIMYQAFPETIRSFATTDVVDRLTIDLTGSFDPNFELKDDSANSSTVTEGDFLCGLNTEDTMDDIPDSQLLNSPENVLEDSLCIADGATLLVATPRIECDEESKDSSFHDDQQNVCYWEADLALTSTTHLDSVQLSDGKVICVLNTEDSEIPCNDDIFMHIHQSSVRPQIATDFIDPLFSSADLYYEFDSAQPHIGYTFRSESFDTKCLHPLFGQPDNITNPVLIGDRVLTRDGLDTSATYSDMSLRTEVKSLKIIYPESMDNYLSISDHNNSESDDDLPCFSDIEALIHRMDLEYAEKSYITSEVGRPQYNYSKRTITRLEQTSLSSSQRAMSSLGALAVFYSRHFNFYIKKTEVVIGRSTKDADVDIDLRKVGRANMISRTQATIKMEIDGSFTLTNLGKSSISMNGNSVAHGQVAALSSSCLIEISGMKFMFEINESDVRRYLDNIIKESQGVSRTFEWSPEDEYKEKCYLQLT